MTLQEVSQSLRISRWQVYQLINQNALRTVRIGRRRLVARQDLNDYIDHLRQREARP